MTYRTAFLLLHKIREAITQTVDHAPLSGIVEIDGGHFCGKWRKPRKKMTARERGELAIPNKFATSQHRSRVPNWARGQHPKRHIVIALREVSEEATGYTDPRTLKPRTKGAVRTLVAITKSENAADIERLVRKYVEPGSLIRTDELPAYGNLKYMGYRHQVVNHSKEFCTDDGINQNQAESFIARPRRSVIGVHHHIAPVYILNYMNEMAWREDVRRMDTREQFENLAGRVFSAGISSAFFNYGYDDRTRQKEKDARREIKAQSLKRTSSFRARVTNP